MRLPKMFFLITATIFCFLTTSFAEEYQTGGVWPDEIPEWMLPSPTIELNNPLLSLDESCSNSEGLPPVGHQGQSNSCTAWSCGYYMLSYMQGQEHNWDMTDPDHQMSPAFVYNLLNRGYDGGSSAPEAFKLFKEIGCAPYSDMPYEVSNYTSFPGEQAFRNAHQFRIAEAYTIDITTNAGATDLKNHLLNGNLAIMAIGVYDDFQHLSDFNNTYCTDNIVGNFGSHTVACIGFDDNFQTRDGVGAWRMVNSWGTDWGDNGFWWLSYEGSRHTNLTFPTAFYGTDRIAYQPSMLVRIEINHTDRHRLKFGMSLWGSDDSQEYFTFNEHTRLPNTEVAFDPNIFTIDITDIINDVNLEGDNFFSFSTFDLDGSDGYSGEIVSARIKDLQTGFIAEGHGMPVLIPDSPDEVIASINLNYAAVPPENLNAALDMSSGEVNLTWFEITTSADFIGYDIFRNGELIANTFELSYQDDLTDYGIFEYGVKSKWHNTSSPFSNIESIFWAEPVAVSNLNVASVESDGTCSLMWDQTRSTELGYDDGEANDNIMFGENVDPGAKIAQTFTAPLEGKLNKLGMYIKQVEGVENGLIRLAVYSNSQSDTPESELWVSEQFTPDDSEYWVWIDLGIARIWLTEGERFWVAIIWDENGKTPLGIDLNAPLLSSHMGCINGQTWFPMGNANPMIRAEYGNDEYVDGIEGLVGFNVYNNGNLVETIESDDHNCSTILESVGDYTFRVDAVYPQGIVTGEDLEYYWDGNAVDVIENNLPDVWSVATPYPNPFNPSTMLTVEMADAAKLNVDIFNILGQKVATLASGKYENGVHRFHFNAYGLTSGIYFIRTEVPGKINSIQKVTFIQ